MDLIAVLIAGAVLAIIASLIQRGSSGMPWWGNWIAGIGGVLLGYWLAGLFGVAETDGIDWIRWIISVAVAVVLLFVGGAIFGRRRRA
jgi:MprA protease rhombosortase-interaction domain-containing protein